MEISLIFLQRITMKNYLEQVLKKMKGSWNKPSLESVPEDICTLFHLYATHSSSLQKHLSYSQSLPKATLKHKLEYDI